MLMIHKNLPKPNHLPFQTDFPVTNFFLSTSIPYQQLSTNCNSGVTMYGHRMPHWQPIRHASGNVMLERHNMCLWFEIPHTIRSFTHSSAGQNRLADAHRGEFTDLSSVFENDTKSVWILYHKFPTVMSFWRRQPIPCELQWRLIADILCWYKM